MSLVRLNTPSVGCSMVLTISCQSVLNVSDGNPECIGQRLSLTQLGTAVPLSIGSTVSVRETYVVDPSREPTHHGVDRAVSNIV